MDLKKCKVLVSATSYGKNDPSLITSLEEQVGEVIFNTTGKYYKSPQLADLLAGVDGFIPGLDEIDEAALNKADRLKVISRYGIGIDNVDLEFARKKKIIVTNTPGANSASVAELALGLILSLLRHIPNAVEATRRGDWPRMNGLSLVGKSIGIIGFGSIGRELARRLSGFQCNILAYDPFQPPANVEKFGANLIELNKVLSQSDLVSLHLPATNETKKMVNQDFLSRMKPGSYLINTARGDIIDEAALLGALESGQIAGAALDVFTEEPPVISSPLFSHPNLLVTPHMAAHTDGATNAMGWMSLTDCLAVLKGEEPRYRVA